MMTTTTGCGAMAFSTREKKTPAILNNYFNSDPHQSILETMDAASRRCNKPLGWFTDPSHASTQDSYHSPGLTPTQTPPPPAMTPEPSEDSKDASSSNNSSSGKRRGKKGGRQRLKKLSVNFTIVGSQSHKDVVPERVPSAVPAPAPVQQAVPEDRAPVVSSQTLAASANSAVPKERKDDYWYYDPVSDGFYYENNGSRGWRKRNPKIHGPPPTAASRSYDAEKEAVKNHQMLVASVTQRMAAAAVAQQQQTQRQPFRYYDPESDGYYYEMASVDGWRRRTPVSGAEVGSKPKSSTTPTPPQQQQSAFQPSQSSSVHQFSSISRPSVPASGPAGAPPKLIKPAPLLTNRQIEDFIVHQATSSLSSNNAPAGAPPVSSTTSPSLTDDLSSTSSPAPAEQQSKLMPHFRRIQGLQQSGSSSNNCQTSFSVGSADEPYEFYWSDTEKASSIGSAEDGTDSTTGPSPQSHVPQPLSQAHPVRRPGYLSMAPWGNGGFGFNTVPMTPASDRPNFDVDRFINDLPDNYAEKFLQRMTALPTPLTPGPRGPFSDGPAPSDSPLYTPMKENTLWTPFRTPSKSEVFGGCFGDDAVPQTKTATASAWHAPCA